MTTTSSIATVAQGTWNPAAIVETIIIADAVDASLYSAICAYGSIRDGAMGKTIVTLNGWYSYHNTLQLPDGTDIDIIRNRGLVYLHDWHNDADED